MGCRGVEPTATAEHLRALAADGDAGAAARPEGALLAYVSDRAVAWSPTWSPDGTRIAFASNRDGHGLSVWVVPAGGGEPVKYTQLGGTSPDGSRIAFTSFRQQWSGPLPRERRRIGTDTDH